MNIIFQHDHTLSTGFKTPVCFDRLFIVDETTTSSEYQQHIAPFTPRIIGGGTNYLFVCDRLESAITYQGSSIRIIQDNETNCLIRVEAGMNWHAFVIDMLKKELFSLENLVLIPGTVGAAPVQNIGAYGMEVSESIRTVHCRDIRTGENIVFSQDECSFSYRDSIFKRHEYSHFLITHVDFELSKYQNPKASYPDVSKYLSEQSISYPSSHDIAKAIIAIRSNKLPDPNTIGNAGSFFKNPIITINHYQELTNSYPNLPSYPIDDTMVKVPAAWLIDTCGLKGYRHKGAGVHDKQALVLINANKATGKDIHEISLIIQDKVYQIFGIHLEPEVNIIL